MHKWILALRPKTVGMAVLVVPVSFAVVNQPINGLTLLVMVFIAIAGSATMLTNDFVDRFHDQKKGKFLAFENPRRFLILTVLLWILSTISCIGLTFFEHTFGLVAFLLLLLGMSYSFLLKIPFWPMFHVSIASSGSILFALSKEFSLEGAGLALLTFIYITGREVLKDIEDQEIDLGYKWTIPSKYGEKAGRLFVSTLYLCAGILLLILTKELPLHFKVVSLSMIALAIVVAKGVKHKIAKLMGDVVIALAMTAFLLT